MNQLIKKLLDGLTQGSSPRFYHQKKCIENHSNHKLNVIYSLNNQSSANQMRDLFFERDGGGWS